MTIKLKLSLFTLLFFVICFLVLSSFSNRHKIIQETESVKFEFHKNLRDYQLYDGDISELIPAVNVELFEISTPLHSDYAEKQRLIKLPEGTSIQSHGDGLPSFPDGTILAKTFYYHKDSRDPEQGKTILETRLLIKDKSDWRVGTYQWAENQDEAKLISKGNELEVDWVDTHGENRIVYFNIPSNKQCSECHELSKRDMPIGPRLRSLNLDVERNGEQINQLQYFINIGLLSDVDIESISALPDWEDDIYSIEQRARAYLDINCYHCHNPKGSAADRSLFLQYETSFDSTGIADQKKKILKRILSENESQRMPSLGVTEIHKEGVALLREYLENL